MPAEDEIRAGPMISEEFRLFEEFCSENTGRESAYLDLVFSNPLEMDAITLAFSMRHMIRLSRELLEFMLNTLDDSEAPDVSSLLAVKGIQLDKNHAARLREVIFAFRDCPDKELRKTLVSALQLMTISRERRRVTLTLGESYAPTEEGWTSEDFGGDDSVFEAVRSIEDAHWRDPEET